MKKILGLAMLTLLVLTPQVLASSVGLVQDYMESETVKVPKNGYACHRIWLATGTEEEVGAVKLDFNIRKVVNNTEVLTELPNFIEANLNEDGIYATSKGNSSPIIFRISAPLDSEVGDIWKVNLGVSSMKEPTEGQVQIIGAISSGFDIEVVDETFQPDIKKCEALGKYTPLPEPVVEAQTTSVVEIQYEEPGLDLFMPIMLVLLVFAVVMQVKTIKKRKKLQKFKQIELDMDDEDEFV